MKLFLVSLFIVSLECYSRKTHNYLGNLSESSLQKDVLSNLKEIVGSNLGKASSWADTIKKNPKYKWAHSLHYIDMPCGNYTKPSIVCNNSCIFTEILNITNSLKYNKRYNTKKNTVEDTKFLIHFLQDFNQPLHMLGKYRGGNNYNINLVLNNNKTIRTNMHYLWDSYIPEYFVKNFKYNAPNIQIKVPNNILDFELYLRYTLLENLKLACKNVKYNIHTIVFEDYFDENVVKLFFDSYIIMSQIIFTFIYK